MNELAELMKAAQDGDADAYALLLRLIAPRVRQVVHRTRSGAPPEDIEDLVQDVLLSVHAARATYDPQRPFTPWLLAIVRHRLADGARQYARSKAHEVAMEDPDSAGVAATTAAAAETFEDMDALRRAIEALPPGQRQAIERLKLREQSLKEAAADTGLSIAALKVASHRAMASLRKALSGPTHP